MTTIPQMALSIRNPWAFLIAAGLKPVENREWRTNFRGPFAIHAGKAFDADARRDLVENRHPVTGASLFFIDGMPKGFLEMTKGDFNGGIIGVAEIVDCVEVHPSDYFVGPYGFVVENAHPIPRVPCRGVLGFFDWRRQIEAEGEGIAA